MHRCHICGRLGLGMKISRTYPRGGGDWICKNRAACDRRKKQKG